jgi:hypothetical protein
MRSSILFLTLILAGCGSSSGGGVSVAATPSPTNSQMTVTQHAEASAAPAPTLPDPATMVITGATAVVLTQPELGWFPRWTVAGGSLTAGQDIFHATITPTADTCTVTITWYQLSTPPAPPSANG